MDSSYWQIKAVEAIQAGDARRAYLAAVVLAHDAFRAVPALGRELMTFRRQARQAAGAANSIEVVAEAGAAAPRYEGEAAHYETRTGRRIYHPSAYSRRGWSSMRYVRSTLAVVVGSDWRPTA